MVQGSEVLKFELPLKRCCKSVDSVMEEPGGKEKSNQKETKNIVKSYYLGVCEVSIRLSITVCLR